MQNMKNYAKKTFFFKEIYKNNCTKLKKFGKIRNFEIN